MDERGRLYLLDGGDVEVDVFDAGGGHVDSFGRGGEGPGELGRPSALAVAGDRLVVNDSSSSRLSVWSLEGEHLEDLRPAERLLSRPFLGVPGGVLGAFGTLTREGGRTTFGQVFLDGGAPLEYLSYEEVVLRIGGPAPDTYLKISHSPRLAAGPGGAYVTRGDEYQVLAVELDGRPRWALRVAWPRQPFPEEEIDRVLENERRRNPDLARSSLTIAEHAPTLGDLRVDGHGHLYVYRRVPPVGSAVDVPVDVYSADGERLFAGTIPGHFWRAVHGDHVWTFGTDPESGETRLVRHQLVEPFR